MPISKTPHGSSTSGGRAPSTTFHLTPSRPVQAFTVKPTREGASLQFANGCFRLERDQAFAIADAIVDACEYSG